VSPRACPVAGRGPSPSAGLPSTAPLRGGSSPLPGSGREEKTQAFTPPRNRGNSIQRLEPPPPMCHILRRARDGILGAEDLVALRTSPRLVRFVPIGYPMTRPALVSNDLMRRPVDVLPEPAVLARSVVSGAVSQARSVEANPATARARLRVAAALEGCILSLPLREVIHQSSAFARQGYPSGTGHGGCPTACQTPIRPSWVSALLMKT
jgi:hypothetical protein